ncbi:hypothetical protein [Thauera humireducens]|uniref:hypothetical protein n=1 Tax=Thauera humireducens TaxID=1134435 RepID=UPI003120255F
MHPPPAAPDGPSSHRADGPGGPRFAVAEIAALRVDRSRLIQLRWFSVAAMVAMAVIAFPLLAPGHPAQPLLGVALALAAVNLALQGAGTLARRSWRRVRAARARPRRLGSLPVLRRRRDQSRHLAAVARRRRRCVHPAVAPGLGAGRSGRRGHALLWEFHHPVRLADAASAMFWHLAGMWASFALAAVTVVWFIVRLNAAIARGGGAGAGAGGART